MLWLIRWVSDQPSPPKQSGRGWTASTCFEDVSVPCSNCLVTTTPIALDRNRRHGVGSVPERERTAHDHSRSDHRKPRHHQYIKQTAPVGAPECQEVVMKRSTARRARRWVIQELARSLDQLSGTTIWAVLPVNGASTACGDQSSFSESS